MEQQKKRKPGRPKLAKGEAKRQIVPIRFNEADIKQITVAAKVSNQTVSAWVRGAVRESIGRAVTKPAAGSRRKHTGDQ